MDKNNKINTAKNANAKKTGARRPSKAVSTPNSKFIQYPTGNSANPNTQNTNYKKTLKPNPIPNGHRKSRKILRKQRNKNILTTAILVIILLAICFFISLKVLFIVRDVEVVGSERYTAEEVKAYCAIPLEENIFKIDTALLETSLPEEFTYIENADIQLKLPDKILISITDSVPTYYSKKQDGDLNTYTIYSQNFKRLTAQAAAPDTLVGISADLEDENTRQLIFTMIDTLHQSGYEGITEISVDTEKNISLVYDDRVQINLGTMLDMDYKLKMCYHVLLNELTEQDRGTLDSKQSGSVVFKPEN